MTGDIDADTSGGGIRIVEAGGHVKADTSGGGIEASFARGNSSGGSLSTSGGGIEVSIDPGADLAIEASGNAVRTDLPLAVRGEISRGHLSGNARQGRQHAAPPHERRLGPDPEPVVRRSVRRVVRDRPAPV